MLDEHCYKQKNDQIQNKHLYISLVKFNSSKYSEKSKWLNEIFTKKGKSQYLPTDVKVLKREEEVQKYALHSHSLLYEKCNAEQPGVQIVKQESVFKSSSTLVPKHFHQKKTFPRTVYTSFYTIGDLRNIGNL